MIKLSAIDADVAHLVERNLAKVEVASSSLVIRSIFSHELFRSLTAIFADVAHLVERNLAKVEVASSSLVIRSKDTSSMVTGFIFCQNDTSLVHFNGVFFLWFLKLCKESYIMLQKDNFRTLLA